jgi:DNA processing protein
LSDLSAEQRALFALTLVSGLGPRLIRALLDRFGSAQATLHAPAAQLAAVPHISTDLAAKFRLALDTANVDEELERMRQHQVQLVFAGQPDYPAALMQVKFPPALLYVRGAIEPPDNNAIAIVGSRNCTAYGRRVAGQLASDLARAGWTVVSGLARGIDAAAHRGALDAGGRTIAVLAGGLSAIYPPEHKDLADQVQHSGALVTEFNMRMEPLPVLFPMRNRIISGISRAVVVVEANQRSGALITADHALNQDRDVFAVPGPVDSSASAGALQLLRDGARVVRNADDILEDLQGVTPRRTPREQVSDNVAATEEGTSLFDPTRAVADDETAPSRPVIELDETQRRVWDLLDGAPRSPDDMIQELGLNVSQLSVILLTLEMRKVIRRLPGNRYERT